MDWFRWYHGTTSNHKMQLVARLSGTSVAEVVAVWAVLLERASSAKVRGNVGQPSFRAIDCGLGLPEGRVATIYAAMVGELIGPNGEVLAWQDRQPQREDSSAERMRAHRAKKQRATTHSVTHGDASDEQVTQGDARSHVVTHGDCRGEERREDPSGGTPPTAPLTPRPPFGSPVSDLPDPGSASDGATSPLPISNPKTTEGDQASPGASQPEILVRQHHNSDGAFVRPSHNSGPAGPLVLVEPPPKGKKAGPITLPDWLPVEAWERWKAHRREIRHPLKPTAERTCLTELEKWHKQGHDPVAVIDKSIAAGWRGLFEPKDSPKRGPSPMNAESRAQLKQEWDEGMSAEELEKVRFD